MGELVLVVPVLDQLAVAAGQLVAVLAEQGELLLRVNGAEELRRAGVGERLALLHALLLRLDRVVLGDLEPLVGLHAVVADELGAVRAPAAGQRVVVAAAALQLGQLVGYVLVVAELEQELVLEQVGSVHEVAAEGALDACKSHKLSTASKVSKC